MHEKMYSTIMSKKIVIYLLIISPLSAITKTGLWEYEIEVVKGLDGEPVSERAKIQKCVRPQDLKADNALKKQKGRCRIEKQKESEKEDTSDFSCNDGKKGNSQVRMKTEYTDDGRSRAEVKIKLNQGGKEQEVHQVIHGVRLGDCK